MASLSDFKDEEIQAELARRQGTKPRTLDPKAAADAEVAVIKAAKQRNPNTPAQFESMTDESRGSHWDKYFGKKSPGPATPTAFWKTYANGPSADQIASTAGTGEETQTPYGAISSTTRLGDARSPRFGPQKTYGATLPPANPVSPEVPVRPSLTSDVPDFEPGSAVSFPSPVAPTSGVAPVLPQVHTKFGPSSGTPISTNPLLPTALAARPSNASWIDGYNQQQSLVDDFRKKLRSAIRPTMISTLN